MKKFKPVILFFIGFIAGIIVSISIVEKQFWFWHVTKDRDMLVLEIRKINLERQEIDDLVRSIKGFMREVEKAWATKEEK